MIMKDRKRIDERKKTKKTTEASKLVETRMAALTESSGAEIRSSSAGPGDRRERRWGSNARAGEKGKWWGAGWRICCACWWDDGSRSSVGGRLEPSTSDMASEMKEAWKARGRVLKGEGNKMDGEEGGN